MRKRNGHKGDTLMKEKHALYEVFKDDFDPKMKWRVQMPKGRMAFRTKKEAVAFAEKAAALDEAYVCDKCGEHYDEFGPYETADGEYVCLDCHSSAADHAEYMMEDR